MHNITKLSNKFQVATQTMNETETVAISLWVKVGSRYETIEQNGISHFLEHMAFKGTKKRTALDIAKEFDDIGGQFNACTGREHTIYYAKVLKNDFEKATDILADIIQNSVFESKEIEKEREVILQELAMTNDTPDDIIFDHYQDIIYKNQPFGRTILGPEKNIKSFNSQDMHDYIRKYYFGKNMFFSVAGNISHKRVVDFAQEKFANISSDGVTTYEPSKFTAGEFRKHKDLEQIHFIMGFEGISYKDEDLYTMQLLSNILGGGMSSRLFQEVREKRGLAYSIYAYNSSYCDTGNFNIYASTSPENINQLIEVSANQILETANKINDDEVQRAKSQIKASLLMGMERSSYRAEIIAQNYICFGRNISNKEIIQKIDNISASKMQHLLNKIIKKNKASIAALGPVKKMHNYSNIISLFG